MAQQGRDEEEGMKTASGWDDRAANVISIKRTGCLVGPLSSGKDGYVSKPTL